MDENREQRRWDRERDRWHRDPPTFIPDVMVIFSFSPAISLLPLVCTVNSCASHRISNSLYEFCIFQLFLSFFLSFFLFHSTVLTD